MLLENAQKSTVSQVKVKEPHFKVFPEFKNVTYAERYSQLLTKLVRKRLYDACCFLLSPRDHGLQGVYSEPNPELSFRNFVVSLTARAFAVAQTQPSGPPEPPKVEAGPPEDATCEELGRCKLTTEEEGDGE